MREPLRVAVIGCGAVSKNHGKALAKSELATLVYGIDIDEGKAISFCNQFGGIPLTDYTQIFEKKDIDLVHIVTPHNTHPQIAIDCMEHGIHVFCEKPLAMRAYDAKHMIEVSHSTGSRLGVCFQNRMNPSTQESKQILASNEYGKLVSAMALVTWDRHGDYYSKSPWRGTYEGEGGGCIINQAIHTIDLLNYLTDGVHSVSACDMKLRDTDDYEVEDSAMALFTFKNGSTGVGYFTNCYPLSKVCNVELHLEHAVLTVKQNGLLIETENGNNWHPCESASGEKSEWGLSHGALINEFHSAVITGSPSICDCETGLAAVRIVNAIQHSHGKKMIVDKD